MKKLMILGAGILQLPAILKAKEMGLQVIAADMDKNAVGFKEADICLEISTIDTQRLVAAAREYRIDGVMTMASDMPMRSVAAIAEALDLVGISMETALKATNKALMRECWAACGVPVPEFYRVEGYDQYLDAISRLKGRCIVKPADNSGSRGVFLIRDHHDESTMEYAYDYGKKYSRSGVLVVEEYMTGPEVSVETLSVDGDVNIIAITDKLTTGAPRFVEMGHSQPSGLDGSIRRQIGEAAVSAVGSIGIENGPSHTEIIITESGPKIVELGARLGGDNITSHLVPLSTGVDMVGCCIDIAMGARPVMEKTISMGSAIRYFETPAGKITDIRGVDAAQRLPGIKQISFVRNIGDIIGEVNNSADRIGFVISQARDAGTAIRQCERAVESITICVEG